MNNEIRKSFHIGNTITNGLNLIGSNSGFDYDDLIIVKKVPKYSINNNYLIKTKKFKFIIGCSVALVCRLLV